MGYGEWLRGLWNKFLAAFTSFAKEVFTKEVQLLIGQFKDFAIIVVAKLSTTDLSSAAKREEAFKAIKEEAIKQGKTLSDSMINLLIELAYQRLKNVQ